MKDATFITRVRLQNYKSVATCDVRLGPLNFLVGPNGAGKSNFLDALRFVTDSLRSSLDHALRDRSGIKEVRRRSGGHSTHFGIRLEFRLREGRMGHYAFRIGALRQGYEVQQEECRLEPEEALSQGHYFSVCSGVVTSSAKVTPPASRDRLYLVTASGLNEFRPIYDALSHMGFYNLNPARIRDLQPPDPGDLLSRDGGNLPSVLATLKDRAREKKERIEKYLAKVVEGVESVDQKVIASKETLEFRQRVSGSREPWRFLATNMSDGTLRALGILVALLQNGSSNGVPVRLVGIEEPEVTLHPAAVGVLLDALREASAHTQVVVTSHSPDLLDDRGIAAESLLAVTADGGDTRIAPIDEAGRSALRDRLYTAGELLRMDQLRPEPSEIARVQNNQLDLFDEEGRP